MSFFYRKSKYFVAARVLLIAPMYRIIFACNEVDLRSVDRFSCSDYVMPRDRVSLIRLLTMENK